MKRRRRWLRAIAWALDPVGTETDEELLALRDRVAELETAAVATLGRIDAYPVDDPGRFVNAVAWMVLPLKDALGQAAL